MIKIISRLSIFVILFSFGCKDNPVNDLSDNSFSVEIRVVDSVGNPIPNIKVSIWNKINYVTNLKKVNSDNEINASTTIQYTIVQQCFVNLTIYNLNNEFVKELVSGQYQAGAYAVAWSTILSNGVYKCILTTSSDSLLSTVLYQDSIYVSLISPDPTISLIGLTNNEGSVKVIDKLLFPHLFNLPLIPRTLEGGPEIVGYYDYSDSVVIALSNETISKTVMFDRLVVDGPNKYKFTLDNNFSRIVKNQKLSGNQLSNNFELKSSFGLTDTTVITSFTASVDNEDVILYWITSEEFNNEGFEIQRSLSSIQDWISIGFVPGHGTTNETHVYSFRDSNLISDSYKYRLKQINFDGTFSYSQEIAVDLAYPLAWKLFHNYPNPFN